MKNQLNENIIRLARARQAIQDQKDAIVAQEDELHETDIYKSITLGRERLTRLSDIEQETYNTVKELALSIYAEEGKKTITDDVKIGIHTVFSINEELAFNWALEHKTALKLDIPAVKKQVKADVVVDGVTTSKEIRAKIATDLSGHLDA